MFEEINRYELLSLDVWGNTDDGYEINQSFHTGIFMDLPACDSAKDYALAWLFEEGYCTDDLTLLVDNEDSIEFVDANDGKPCFYFQSVKHFQNYFTIVSPVQSACCWLYSTL